MTTTATEQLQHLDFDPVLPCGTLRCRENPQPAVLLLVTTMPCCAHRDPICATCAEVVRGAQRAHLPTRCREHGATCCLHTVYRLEPLP